MQQYHADASGYFKSVDIIHFEFAHDNQQVALEAHTPSTREEIELVAGDKISVTRKEKYNYYNGYSKGTNMRTFRVGLYPSYKAEEEVSVVKMPTYPEASRDNHNAAL